MGWKLSSIIISPATDVNYEHVLEEIGFSDLKAIGEAPYDVVLYPDQDKIYIGTYKNNLIISSGILPFEFFNTSLSALEEKLMHLFPDSEIGALSLHSGNNHWGYVILKNGKKIRARAGDMDHGTFLDLGEPLAEEMELLSNSRVDENGNSMYYLGKDAFEAYFEHQVGENFVFEIFKRYTGIALDKDSQLLETNFKGYQTYTQSDKAAIDDYFTGEWDGYYILGNGYSDKLKGQKTNFTIRMKVHNGEITGTKTDEDKKDDKPGTIRGMIVANFINFQLHYSVHYFFNQSGEIQKNESRSYSLSYTGLFDALTASFRGIWNIDDTKCWGEWVMKKKQA